MAGSLDDLKDRHMWTAVLAELVGTLFLTLVACGSCMYGAGVVAIALCFGFSVATMVWAIGGVSGGHINPAVTVGFLAARRISVIRAIFYIVAQVVGAIIGAALLKATTPDSLQDVLGAPKLHDGLSEGSGFGVELLITFVLVLTVFAACDNQRSDSAPVALTIGLSIAMCHLWAVPATGSGMNPARSFGPCVVAGYWDHHWIYWVGPLVGGAAAGLIYDLVFAVNATPSKFKGYFTRTYNNDDYDRRGQRPGTAANGALNETTTSETAELKTQSQA